MTAAMQIQFISSDILYGPNLFRNLNQTDIYIGHCHCGYCYCNFNQALWQHKLKFLCCLVVLFARRYVFTARCYASAVLAMGLCLSVFESVTSQSSTKTAKRRITQTTPHDTSGTLVFRRQRSPRNSTGITPCRGAKCMWGGSKSATFDK